MGNENQDRKYSANKSEENSGSDRPGSKAKEDELRPRGRGLSDELVDGETLDVADDPAKPR